MSQIYLKFLEQGLVYNKYYIDIKYFLELWWGGVAVERDKLILSYAFGPMGKFL